MENRLRVAIVFGGKSAEHEVSLQSAQNIIDAIDRNKYQPVLVSIDRNGTWSLSRDPGALLGTESSGEGRLSHLEDKVSLITREQQGQLVSLSSGMQVQDIDVIFPVLHGPYGEDGSIQGLSKLANLPCVGSGILGSAIGMDKDVSKRLLRAAGIEVADFVVLRKGQHDQHSISEVVKRLGFPVFVKPVNMGSSIGVSKAEDCEQLLRSMEVAFQYDTKVLVEAAVNGREIECAVLGNENPIVSVPGEIVPQEEFYSYKAKYIDENGAFLQIPAELDLQLETKVKKIALQAFHVLESTGMARVDMFCTDEGRVLVNEINTIPGFTKISMYPKLWEASGISYANLIDRLITLAVEEYDIRNNLKITRD